MLLFFFLIVPIAVLKVRRYLIYAYSDGTFNKNSLANDKTLVSLFELNILVYLTISNKPCLKLLYTEQVGLQAVKI